MSLKTASKYILVPVGVVLLGLCAIVSKKFADSLSLSMDDGKSNYICKDMADGLAYCVPRPSVDSKGNPVVQSITLKTCMTSGCGAFPVDYESLALAVLLLAVAIAMFVGASKV